MNDITRMMHHVSLPKEERIRGLIGSGLKWLLKLIAPALISKASDTA